MAKTGGMVSVILGVSGLLPLILFALPPHNPTLLIYSLFVLVFLWNRPKAPVLPQMRAGRPGLFVVIYVLVGLLIEIFAWSGNFLVCAPDPALFHPQLIPDLLLAFGFYLGGGIAWAWLCTRYGFSISRMFLIQGLNGVFLEQQGAIFFSGLASFPVGLLLWLYVFAVYGSLPALTRVLVDPGQTRPVQRVWWHFLLALGVALAGAVIGIYGFGLVIMGFGGLPAPGPICLRPFY